MEKIIELFKNSGFTAVLGSLGAVIITGIFNMQIDKRREQQQFIRQILPERIKAHEIIIETLIEMQEKFVRLALAAPEDRLNAIVESYKGFNALLLRNTTWTDSEVSKYCWKIIDLLFAAAFNKDKISFKNEISNQEYIDFMGTFSVYNGHINKRIITSSGMPLLDKILSKMVPKEIGNFLINPKDQKPKASSR